MMKRDWSARALMAEASAQRCSESCGLWSKVVTDQAESLARVLRSQDAAKGEGVAPWVCVVGAVSLVIVAFIGGILLGQAL